MSLTEVLEWLTGSGGGAFLVISWAISWGLEKTEWWENLSSQARALTILGLAAVLGIIATFLKLNPLIVAAMEPYFQPIMYSILAWLGTQIAHKFNPTKAGEPDVVVGFTPVEPESEEQVTNG